MAVSNSTDRFNGVIASLAIKAPCVAVAVANLTLSGEQTVNGVAVVSGDRVLVTAQTNATENGIYDASSSAWARAADWDGNRDVARGTLVTVNATTGKDFFYQVQTADPITIGTTAVTFLLTNSPNVTFPITQAEIDAGLTTGDIDDSYPDPYPLRYGGVADNSTDSLVAIQNACKVSAGSGKVVVIDGPYFVDINDENDPIELLANAHLIFTEKGSIRMDFFGLPLFYGIEKDGIKIENPHLICDYTIATSLPSATAAFEAAVGRTLNIPNRNLMAGLLFMGCDNVTITNPKFTNTTVGNLTVWYECIGFTEHNDETLAKNNRVLGTMHIEAAHNGIIAWGQDGAKTETLRHKQYGDVDPATFTWAATAHPLYFTHTTRNINCEIGQIFDEGTRLAGAFVSSGVTLKLRDFEYGYVAPCTSRRDDGILDTDCRHTVFESLYWEGRDPAALTLAEPFRLLTGGGGVQSSGVQQHSTASTTLDANEAASQTILSVTSTTGFVNNAPCVVILDTGASHPSSIVSFVTDDTVTISDALPSAAASGNAFIQTSAYGKISTTLDANEASGQVVISVTSTGGMALNAPAVITLNDGSTHRSHISAIAAGDTITIEDALPSAADSGNAIFQEAENNDIHFKKVVLRYPDKDAAIVSAAGSSQSVPDHVTDCRWDDLQIYYDGTALDTGKTPFAIAGSDNAINSTWSLPNLSNNIALVRIDNGGSRNHMRALIIDGPFSLLRMSEEHRIPSVDNSIEIIDAKTSDIRVLNNNTSYEIRTASEIVTAASGPTVTASNLIPDGAFVIGLTTIITTALGTSNGTTGFGIGDGSDPNRWGDQSATAKNSITENRHWTAGGNDHFITAQTVTLTAAGGNFDGTGAIRVGVSYMIGESDTNLAGG